MAVGIAVVHPEIAERVTAQAFVAHLPCEGIALTAHAEEMPWHFVETHARLTTHRQLGGGRQVETLERDDKPAMNAREHQQAHCHEAERKADNDAIVLIHSIFGWYESVPARRRHGTRIWWANLYIIIHTHSQIYHIFRFFFQESLKNRDLSRVFMRKMCLEGIFSQISGSS